MDEKLNPEKTKQPGASAGGNAGAGAGAGTGAGEGTGKGVRNYVVVNKDGIEEGVFTGRQPRQAALKAANRLGGTKDKPVKIQLRERGTKKIHIFNGWKEVVAAPKNRPAWMPDKINKPFVKKVGTEKLEKKA